MISNGKDRSLNSVAGGLPNMSNTIMGWFQLLTFTKVQKVVVDHELQETEQEYTFSGVRQPFTAQQLSMKPHGQRKWRWETIHALPDLVLEVDEVINFGELRMRVMERLDWQEYGYVEYHCVRDYDVSSN